MIIRIFRAYVHDGKQEEFQQFFLETALPLVKQQEGLVSATIGTPVPSTPNEFVMITTWKDLDSLKHFAGEHWEKAVIHPKEQHLLFNTTVHHYEGVAVNAEAQG